MSLEMNPSRKQQPIVDESVFAQALASHGATPVTSPGTGAIDAIRFAGGGAVAWRCPCSVDDIERHRGANLVRTVAEVTGAIAAVLADSTRSSSWKEREIERITADGEAAFDKVKVEADRAVAGAVAAIARDRQPPPIGASDHGAALIDFECREWARTLDHDALAAFGTSLLRGEHPRALIAMARSPVPLPPFLAQVIAEAWDRVDPAAAEARQRAQDRADWLALIIRQAEHALPKRTRTASEAYRNAANASRTAA